MTDGGHVEFESSSRWRDGLPVAHRHGPAERARHDSCDASPFSGPELDGMNLDFGVRRKDKERFEFFNVRLPTTTIRTRTAPWLELCNFIEASL